MYIAAKDFKSYKLGQIKKGQKVEFNECWFDEGLIIEGKESPQLETKPEPKAKIETKPEQKKKGKKTK